MAHTAPRVDSDLPNPQNWILFRGAKKRRASRCKFRPRVLSQIWLEFFAGDLGVVPSTVVYRRDAGGWLPIAVWGLAKL